MCAVLEAPVRLPVMTPGICKNCGHAMSAHNGQCGQMVPDNKGGYNQCRCSNPDDSD